MKHWVIATPVMMKLKVYCTAADVPDEWALNVDVGTFVCAPLNELLTAAADNVATPVWDYADVKEQMINAGNKALVTAHENKLLGACCCNSESCNDCARRVQKHLSCKSVLPQLF